MKPVRGTWYAGKSRSGGETANDGSLWLSCSALMRDKSGAFTGIDSKAGQGRTRLVDGVQFIRGLCGFRDTRVELELATTTVRLWHALGRVLSAVRGPEPLKRSSSLILKQEA